MNKAFMVGVLLGLALAITVAPGEAEAARPVPGVVPLKLNGSATQIGVFVSDGGYSVAPVKVDGGALTLPSGAVMRIRCPANVCIGTGSTTSCGGTSLAENAGELVLANLPHTIILKDGSPTLSLMTPSGGVTCPLWKLD